MILLPSAFTSLYFWCFGIQWSLGCCYFHHLFINS